MNQVAREDKMAWVGQVVNEDQVVMVAHHWWARWSGQGVNHLVRCTYLGDQVVGNRVTVVAGAFFVHFSKFTFFFGAPPMRAEFGCWSV